MVFMAVVVMRQMFIYVSTVSFVVYVLLYKPTPLAAVLSKVGQMETYFLLLECMRNVKWTAMFGVVIGYLEFLCVVESDV